MFPRLNELTEILGAEIVAEIITLFATEGRTLLLSLKDATGRGDMSLVCRLAHSVTGAARNVGAIAVASQASVLEQSAAALSPAAVTVAIARLQLALDSAIAEMAYATGQLQAGS